MTEVIHPLQKKKKKELLRHISDLLHNAIDIYLTIRITHFVPYDIRSMSIIAVSGIARNFQALAQLSHIQMLRRDREHRRSLYYLQ